MKLYNYPLSRTLLGVALASTLGAGVASADADAAQLPDCVAQDGTLHSERFDQPIRAQFQNTLDESVALYWLNYEGTLVKYLDIPANKTAYMQTFATHPWIALSAANTCFGPFLPNEGETVMIGGNAKEPDPLVLETKNPSESVPPETPAEEGSKSNDERKPDILDKLRKGTEVVREVREVIELLKGIFD